LTSSSTLVNDFDLEARPIIQKKNVHIAIMVQTFADGYILNLE